MPDLPYFPLVLNTHAHTHLTLCVKIHICEMEYRMLDSELCFSNRARKIEMVQFITHRSYRSTWHPQGATLGGQSRVQTEISRQDMGTIPLYCIYGQSALGFPGWDGLVCKLRWISQEAVQEHIKNTDAGGTGDCWSQGLLGT